MSDNDEFDLNDYADLFSNAEQKYGLPAGLLYRVAKQESNGDPMAEGPPTKTGERAQGLMQIMPSTAKSLQIDPYIPGDAVDGAARLLRENINRYKNIPDALRAYNSGTDSSKWNNKQTNDYVKNITANDPNLPPLQQLATNVTTTPLAYDASDDPLLQAAAGANSDDPLISSAAQARKAAINAPDEDDPLMSAAHELGIKVTNKPPLPGTQNQMEENVADDKVSEPVTPSTPQQDLQKKIDALPLPSRIAANIATNPGVLSPFGIVNALVGGKPTNQQTSISETPGATYARDYWNNLKNAGTAIKNLVTNPFTGNYPANPVQEDIQAKKKAGIPVSADEIAQGFNEATANNPGGEALSALQVLPPVSAATSFINRSVNPLISSVTGLTPAEIQAGETVASPLAIKKGAEALTPEEISPEESPVSDNLLTKAITRDNTTPASVETKLSSMGDEAMLADAAGENTRGIARAIANMPGPAKEIAMQALEERQAGQADRLTQAVTKGLGVDPHATAESTVQDLIKQREVAAKPAYEKAFQSGPVTNDRINQFLADPEIQSGISRGIKIQRLESLANGETFDPKDYAITDFNDAGDPIISGVPNMRLLDSAKKGLDAKISDNTDPVTGKVNELGRALTKVKNAFVKQLDAINPDYAEARQSYSGPSQSIDAINQGQDFIKNGGEINAKILQKISDDDKPFFRIGVAQKISDIMQNTPDGADSVKRIFGTPAKRSALQSVFPDAESFRNFENIVNNEKEFSKTYRAVTQGSRTTPLREDINDLNNQANRFVEGAKTAVRHGVELGKRNMLGQAIYLAGEGINRLTAPKELPQSDAIMLANKLFTPNAARNNAFPVNSVGGNSNLLAAYIDNLARGAGRKLSYGTGVVSSPAFSAARIPAQPIENPQQQP